MNIRIASALLALALPLAAQGPAVDETEALFYKAYYLEKGPKDHAAAMVLYEQFLTKAPEHKLAAEAAKQQYSLLDRLGKSKERDAFKAKYEKLLGNMPATAGGGDAPAGDAPRGRGEGRPDPAARMAELQKQLAKAKEAGNEEEVKRLQQQIERAKQGGERGRGQGGMRGGLFGALAGNKKISEMSADEITQLKDSLDRSGTMIDRMRENGNEDGANKLSTGVEALKAALAANKMEDAQKAMDALRAAMPARPNRGGGRGEGGGGAGRGEGGGGAGRGEGGG